MLYTSGKLFSQTFQRDITSPQIPKTLVGKLKKNQICTQILEF